MDLCLVHSVCIMGGLAVAMVDVDALAELESNVSACNSMLVI